MTYGRPNQSPAATTAPAQEAPAAPRVPTTNLAAAMQAGATNPASLNAAAYLRTQVLTASPEQLRLMLLDGAIKYLRQGREGLEKKDHFASFDGFSKTRNIIVELMNSMKPELAPEVCAKVHGLLVYMYQLVVDAGLNKDIAKADEALGLLEFERETWLLAVEQAANERTGVSKPVLKLQTEAAATPAAEPAAKREYRPLSVQG